MKNCAGWIVNFLLIISIQAIRVKKTEDKENCCDKSIKGTNSAPSIARVVLYQNLPDSNTNLGHRESPGHALDRHQREYYRHAYSNNYGKYGRHPEQKRLKPGLLQVQLQLPDAGSVVAQGPHGERHFIHHLPEQYLSQSGDPVYIRQYHTTSAHGLKSHYRDAAPVVEKDQPDKNQLYHYPVDELSKALAHKLYHPKFVQLYREVVEEYFRDKFGITDLSILRNEKRPIKPSVEFYEYSEPDPLYHSDGILTSTMTTPPIITSASLLSSEDSSEENDHLTIESNKNTEQYVTPNEKVPDGIESPRITNDYPDSINAQLPHYEGDKVPYEAATTNSEIPLSTVQPIINDYSSKINLPLVTETTLIIEVEQAKVTELEAHETTTATITSNGKRQVSKSDLNIGNFSTNLETTLSHKDDNNITKNDMNKESSPLISVVQTDDLKNVSILENNNNLTNMTNDSNSFKSNATLTTKHKETENKDKADKVEIESEKLDSKKVMKLAEGKSPMSDDNNNFDALGHLVLTLVNNAKEQNGDENLKKSS